ncbi:metallophosphoesterase family protein [Microtetraspora niveoalba]|uniref:metallophosphoesterase family protein n=1 Tax=Microtetraspora niveoalba TaxID=46175 RepID=UPI00082EB343|nr:metallophosphoesterase [Microtetraspora niveoalba]
MADADVELESRTSRSGRQSSRVSEAGAGWNCQEIGAFQSLRPNRATFTWLRPGTLWRSRNEILAQLFGDPSNEVRRRWVETQRERGAAPDFRIFQDVGEDFAFLVLGDTGEGDASQYAVVPGLLKAGAGTSFAVIASDVIYPTGSGNEYGDKFFRPYKDYRAPIYAVPGNHDWYDGLGGFMRVFCDAPPLAARGEGFRLSPSGLRGLLWKKPAKIDEAGLAAAREMRSAPEQRATMPAPYWVLDLGRLLLVGIDTGIRGDIDREQGEWLRRVSADPRPKILITGKPIYVRNDYHPCRIEGGGTVDEIVRDPAHNYVAAIGGDVHNYQRFPVRVGDRVIQYIVSGGGGAFMHDTHTIPRVDVGGVHEDDFRCYPLRGDSLSFYSLLYSRRLRMRWLYLTPDEGLALMSRQVGNVPPRSIAAGPDGTPPAPAVSGGASDSASDSGSVSGSGSTAAPVRITTRMKWAARLLGGWPMPFHLPVGRFFHRWISELSDWDTPPFFKSFLHVSVTGDVLRIRCLAATGCLAQELEPPLEDEVEIPLAPVPR